MNTRILKYFFSIFALAMAPAHADDTEIYLGANFGVTEVKPNIVFIIDTSGSMGSEVLHTGMYEPTGVYTPAGGICDPNKIYWGNGATIPDCMTTTQYITVASNKCNAATIALAESGRYLSARVAGWDGSNKRWSDLIAGTDRPLECESDASVHGETAGDYRKYATNGATYGWTDRSRNRVDWRSTGGVHTLYSAHYLDYRRAGGTDRNLNRLQVVQKVLKDLFTSLDGVNAAIMRFDRDNETYSTGGFFIKGMTPLNDATRADFVAKVTTGLTADGYTPLAETLYEAARYYRGESVVYGNINASPYKNSSDITYTDGRYNSPIQYSCQKNYIVLLTDGEPTYDYNADSLIQALPGFATATHSDTCRFTDPGVNPPALGDSDWRMMNAYDDCLDELAQYLNEIDASSTIPNTQNVNTYTIGFSTDQALLENTATKGGGRYFYRESLDGLADAFTAILTEIQAVNTYFSAPAVSVNAFNRLTNLDELYYALFKPSEYPKWDGNIKRYRIGGTPMVVRDMTGAPAIDDTTGFFKTTAKSWWAAVGDPADGDEVKAGGVAAHMPTPAPSSPPVRTVYTWLETANALSAAGNRLHEDNTAITTTMLGVDGYTDPTPAVQRGNVLQWARGVDLLDSDADGSRTDARLQMGDPLHTEPLLITYGKRPDNTPDLTLYATDNEGFLHAFDTKDGTEVFSFIPKDLLPNLTKFYDNNATVRHPYGLDGPMTTWVKDLDHDGSIESGDHVFLYLTMRRGGRNIYALDVTTRSAPTVKWKIQGGSGDFAELGQTWSKPTYARVKLNGAARDVLIFGGGYDTVQDSGTTGAVDTIGRAVYMVDADTGTLLWRASHGTGDLPLTSMTNSIPSEVRVIDMDGDGFSDRMYVGDTGGRMWRFDVKPNNGGRGDFATGGIIANLGGTNENNRRFYYPPSVSLSSTGEYLNIAIGSGWREHPLNGSIEEETTIRDKFFVLRDRNILGPAIDPNTGGATYTAVEPDDLYDATADDIQSTDTALRSAAQTGFDTHPAGYYIDLSRQIDGEWQGEKVLAQALTIDGSIIFTSYTPIATATNSCAPSLGTARYYIIDAEDGGAVVDTNGDGVFARSERSVVLARGGIPPRPTAITTDDGSAILVGTEKISNFMPNRNPTRHEWIRN